MLAARCAAAAALTACIVLGLQGIVATLPVDLNTTNSVPIGLYRRIEPAVTYRRGDFVEFCLPSADMATRLGIALAHGDCPSHRERLIKIVAGLPGDVAIVREDGVWINGRRLPDSRPLRDAHGIPLRADLGRHVVPPGTVWVTSARTGYDSRYFGPVVPKAKALPLVTF
jgi:conjugative transfer signal peptidase TraF